VDPKGLLAAWAVSGTHHILWLERWPDECPQAVLATLCHGRRPQKETEREKAQDHRTYSLDGVIQAPGGATEDGEWGPVESLGQNIVEGVRHIKVMSGPDLILWGSSTLTPMLLEHGLANEILLFVYPVLLGKGKRFFSDGTPPRELALTSTKAASSGVIISTYTPAGPLRTGPS
jgi:RibD C-terminal domain